MSIDLAVIPGDGIGPEVTAVALRILAQATELCDIELKATEYPFGSEHFLSTGSVLEPDDIEQLRKHDAILFGACGDPRVAPGVLERGLILALRLAFDQYVNVRPVRLLPGVETPFANLAPERVDLVILRENTEGLYTGGGGITHGGEVEEIATQISVSSRRGTERLIREGFATARRRRGKVALVHKTNILTFAGSLWERTFNEVASEFPDIEIDYVHVDAMMLHLVMTPERFDVVVTDNLFGDIISDLGAVLQGGLGYAPSACIAADPNNPSSYEPVHGSAPDLAGKGLANPVAAVLSAAMMLETQGHDLPAQLVRDAVDLATAQSSGHRRSTEEMSAAISSAMTSSIRNPRSKV